MHFFSCLLVLTVHVTMRIRKAQPHVPRRKVLNSHPDPAQPLLPLGRWITRQLLTARLHHPAWPLVAFHGLGSVLLLAFALFQGAWLAVLIYELGCVCLLCWIQYLLRPQDPVRVWGWLVGLLPGQVVDGLATLSALFTRHVSWRGIDYAVQLRPSRVVLRRDRGVEV